MAQKTRQSRMFAAEDYAAVYDSYINADFQAYDYDTIRTSMVDYVRNNYPENYNDWIESSEFVAILDLIARFGHSLAYRNDINSRNNFLSTAQRQESVFKLAEFLGYQPKRPLPAFGQLKVVSVKTNEPVVGSKGTSLGGQEIRYESSTNVDNLDDFITVLNAAFAPSNQIGSPRKQATISNTLVQFYNIYSIIDQINFQFNGKVQGSNSTFDAIGLTYNSTQKSIEENSPNPNGAFSVIYKNDGKGISSNNTGFFVGFKQGSLQFQDFQIDSSIGEQSLDINVNNVNNSDVWVQTIDANGNPLKEWTKVDSVFGSSTAFNTIEAGVRDIFSVKTRKDNQISVQFADNAFGNQPSGIVRVWYRPSANQTYVLRPDDIGNKKIAVKYKGIDGNTYTIAIELQLKNSVLTASESETLDSIRVNAPRAYSAQDRMITADDYNNYLVSQSEAIKKIKSINRTHSGHSRYVDITDPTGAYTSLRLYATDGIINKEEVTKTQFSNSTAASVIFDNQIAPLLYDDEVINYYYDANRLVFLDLKADEYDGASDENDRRFIWDSRLKINSDISTGNIVNDAGDAGDDGGVIQRLGNATNNYMRHAKVGSLVKLKHTQVIDGEIVVTDYWTKISRIYNDGLGVENNNGNPTGLDNRGLGAVVFDTRVPDGAEIEIIYPPFTRKFTISERQLFIDALLSKRDFAINYDYINTEWSLNEDPELDLSWMIKVDYDTTTNINRYIITNRVIRYSIESSQIEFGNIGNQYKLQSESNKKFRDQIDINSQQGAPLGSFFVYGYEFAENGQETGVFNNNKVLLVMKDKNQDDRPNNPDSFFDVTDGADTLSELRLEWTHVPDTNEIIDPSFSNIIDVFVLTQSYDSLYRSWLSDKRTTNQEPLPPTVTDLNQQFKEVNTKKAMSDTIIYRPVKYKVLFGNKAPSELQAKFRAIKVQNARITDNELKSLIVKSIENFFSIENWDFGETFYFTELAAQVHKDLSGSLSSFVIVPYGIEGSFGDLFQITPLGDELLIPDVSIDNIDIIDNITADNIRSQ